NDTLTVDLSGGNPFPLGAIVFHGGNESGNRLFVTGGACDTIQHTMNFGAPSHIGTIIFLNGPGGVLNYDGVGPIDLSGTTEKSLTMALSSTDTSAFLEDDGTPGNQISQIRSGNDAFSTLTFRNPSSRLIISRGAAGEALTLNDLPDLTARLDLGSAASPFNSITFAGSAA